MFSVIHVISLKLGPPKAQIKAKRRLSSLQIQAFILQRPPEMIIVPHYINPDNCILSAPENIVKFLLNAIFTQLGIPFDLSWNIN